MPRPNSGGTSYEQPCVPSPSCLHIAAHTFSHTYIGPLKIISFSFPPNTYTTMNLLLTLSSHRHTQTQYSGPFHGCPLLGTGPREKKYQYAYLGNYVPFYSEDMPNTAAWKIEENVVPMVPYRFYVSTHLCSYVCWLSHGIDSETRCYFPRQSVPNPGKYRDDEVCWIYNPAVQTVL